MDTEHWWINMGKQSTGGSTCPSATLSIRNSVFDDLGSSPVFSGEKPATKA